MRVLESSHLTVTKVYKRTWRERLCSWPWRPWRELGYRQVPDPDCYLMKDHSRGGHIMVAHPITADQLRRKLEAADPEQFRFTEIMKPDCFNIFAEPPVKDPGA